MITFARRLTAPWFREVCREIEEAYLAERGTEDERESFRERQWGRRFREDAEILGERFAAWRQRTVADGVIEDDVVREAVEIVRAARHLQRDEHCPQSVRAELTDIEAGIMAWMQ